MARPGPEGTSNVGRNIQRHTWQQLYQIARRNGANENEARTLAAIALAESGGNSRALNGNNRNGSVDYGLWQINSVHKKSGFDPRRANDPDYNAQWAVRIMRDAKGFTPWTVYKTGAYRQYVRQGAAPRAPGGGGRIPGAVAGGAVATGGRGSLQSILGLGMSFIGTPYKWGGAAPGGFDCSGLLQYIFRQNGINIPRVSRDQARAGMGVAANQAQAGDLVAFDNSSARPGVDHIGIYLGNGLMLQAPRTGRNVEVVKVNLNRAVAIRRIPGANAAGLPVANGRAVFPARAGQGATPPDQIMPETGGGDMAMGTDTSSMFGPDGKIDPAKAIETYGFIAELANSVPDIKRTLEQAVVNRWTGEQFQARLQQTGWWRKTSEAQRANELLKKQDPGEYRRRRQQMIDKMNITARRLGVKEGKQRIFILAERALAMGMSDAEVERLIAADARIAPKGSKQQDTGQTAITVDSLREQARAYRINLDDRTLQQWVSNLLRGDLPPESFRSFLVDRAKAQNPDIPLSAFERGMTVDDYRRSEATAVENMKAQARQFLVPLSDATLKKWTQQITAGDVPAEGFTNYLKEQAKSLFPTLAGAIDRGITVEQYTEPYRQIAAQTLELNPEQIDFTNPVYGKALLNTDPKTNERSAMGLADFQTYLRGRPEYRRTRQANESAAEFTNTLTEMFGKVAFS